MFRDTLFLIELILYKKNQSTNMNVNYTELILKSLKNSLTGQEKIEFETWLSIDGNDKQYQKLRDLWDTSGTMTYPEIEAQLNVDEAYNKVLQRTQFLSHRKKRRSIRPYLVAASLALLVAAFGYLTLGVNELDYQSITAEANMEYTLPDNSTLWMSKGSEISYQKDFINNRNIKMNGQVMYEVTHNPDKPFTIDADGMDVTVLGTKFIVSNTVQSEYVHVINGKVQVDDKQGKAKKLILTKNMTANRESGNMSMTDNALGNDMFWASESLSYNNASLEKIFDELETYFDVTIETNNRFAKCPFTGIFTDDKLDEILSTLEVIYELNINKNSEIITITGPSCK